MIEINLVPDVKQELIKAQRVRSTVITAVIFIGLASIAVVVALAIYIYTVQTVRGAFLDGDIKTKNTKLAKVSDLSKTLTIQNQLTKISDLNSNKKIDSRIFDLLTAITPLSNSVQISDLAIDSSTNTITIDGQGQESNGYHSVETFKKTIEGAKVKYNISGGKTQELTMASDISISNTSLGQDSSGRTVLRFTLSFAYVQELFSPLSKNVSIIITTKGNATDSYIGFPKSIFADRATDKTGGQ